MSQWRQDDPNKRPPTRAAAISAMGQNRPLALQKRSGGLHLKARQCSPDRDGLSIKRLREMTEATAGVHRGAWRRGSVAARGVGAAWRPHAAGRGAMYEGENDPDGKARLSAFTQGVAESAWTERRNVHGDVFGSMELHRSYQPTTLWIVTVGGATMAIVPVRRMVSGLLRLQLLHEFDRRSNYRRRSWTSISAASLRSLPVVPGALDAR
jgi:hypothetical protein